MSFLLNPFWFQTLEEPDGGMDPYFDSVVLLVGFEGTHGATSAVDESDSGHALTFSGNAQIDTSQSKFGGGSLKLVRAGNGFVWVADHADFVFGADSFTIESWARFADVSTWQTIISQWGAAGNEGFLLDMFNNGTNTGQRGMYTPNGSTDVFTQANSVFVADTWYHMVYERAATVLRVYRDGTMLAKTTGASTGVFNSTAQLRIGALNAALPNHMDGWLEEVRVTRGIARYNSDGGYAVPTDRFPRLAAPPPTLDLTDTKTSTANDPTFVGVLFGDEPAVGETRHIAITMTPVNASGGNGNLVGVTIGGVTASRVTNWTTLGGSGNAEIWIAAVPSGTSGNVVCNVTGGYDRWSLVAYRIGNLSNPAAHSIMVSVNGTLNVPKNALVLAVASTQGSTTYGTFSGIGEDYHVSAGSAHHGVHGSRQPGAATTLSLSYSVDTIERMVAAALL